MRAHTIIRLRCPDECKQLRREGAARGFVLVCAVVSSEQDEALAQIYPENEDGCDLG